MNQIPEGWKNIKFDDFTTLQRGKDLTKKSFQPGNVPVAGSNGIIGYHNVSFVKAPGVTVGRSGSCGKVNFYTVDFWAHNTSLYVRDFHGNDERFAAFFLDFLDLGRFHTGASVPTLDRNSFRQLPITIPEATEQRRIAHVLTIVQTAIEQQTRLIELTHELKSALMRKLFTEGLRGEKQKETEIGPVPESWEIVALGNVLNRKIVDGVHKTPIYIDSGIPFITAKDIVDNEVNFGECRFISLEEHQSLTKRVKPVRGDVLLTKVGTVGKVAVIDFDQEFSIFVQIALINPNQEKIASKYLYWALQSEAVQIEIMSRAPQSTMKFIGTQKIAQVQIQLPSIVEQNQIAEILDTLQRKIRISQKKKNYLEELFHTLLQQLMTAQIRVKDMKIEESIF